VRFRLRSLRYEIKTMEPATFRPAKTSSTGHRAPAGAVLLFVLGLGACDQRNLSSSNGMADKPIDVASTVAGCADLEDCNRQCAGQRANACVSAGRLYDFGRGVAADPARAFRLYEQACDLSYAGGCYNAAILLETAKGVGRDLDRARRLYRKVCDMGSKTSCERAAALEYGR
jgi:TPR repeat protein